MNHASTAPQVPYLSSLFLRWALPENLVEPVLGDLHEEFTDRQTVNHTHAVQWYRKQAIKTALLFMLKTKKGLFMFIFSMLLFVALTMMAMWLGGSIDMFINIPSIIVILPPAIAFSIAATSWQDVKQALASVVSTNPELDQTSYQKSQLVFKVMGNSAMLLGFMMTLIGAVAMASNITSNTFSDVFGPAFAVCILTLIYALNIKLVCYVAEQRLVSLEQNR